MDKLYNIEQMRIILVSVLSPILGYFTPTRGFITALIIMFAFNIWCGMRADGVVIKTCKNFSFKKFKNALMELLLYLIIIEVVFSVMTSIGDTAASLLAIKSLTYVFMYVYLQNAFRNLITAYPRNVAIRLIYHVIRLEFKRAMPSHIQGIIDRLDNELDKVEHENNKDNETKINSNS